MKIFTVISLTCMAWISTSSANLDSKCLHAHNVFRDLHAGTPRLKWDAALAYEAQIWAQRLIGLGKMEHSYVKGQGENIYYKKGQRAGTCAEAVHAWYGEIKDYDYKYPGFSSATGHFTQVIWKGSTYVGVGIATSSHNGQITTYIVAKYVPQGNMEGKFAANVLPKTSAKMPTVFEIDPSLCSDTKSQSTCKMYLDYKFCVTYKKYMTDYCAKTCGLC